MHIFTSRVLVDPPLSLHVLVCTYLPACLNKDCGSCSLKVSLSLSHTHTHTLCKQMFSSRCLPHLSQYLYVLYFFFSLSFSISLSVSVSICFCLRRIVYFRQFASIILICPMPLIFLKNFLRHCDLNPGWRLQCELPYTLDHSAIQTPPRAPIQSLSLCLSLFLCSRVSFTSLFATSFAPFPSPPISPEIDFSFFLTLIDNIKKCCCLGLSFGEKEEVYSVRDRQR